MYILIDINDFVNMSISGGMNAGVTKISIHTN